MKSRLPNIRVYCRSFQWALFFRFVFLVRRLSAQNNNLKSIFQLLQSFCDPIVNKPKPKVEPPKDTPKETPATEEGAAKSENPEQQQNSTTEDAQQSTPPPTTESMETDTPKQPSDGSKPLDMEVD